MEVSLFFILGHSNRGMLFSISKQEEKSMSSTALGAEKAIIFISDAHEKFYYEKLKEVRYTRP